jgi:DNA-binding NarL/FixJ family response regulator
MGSGFVTSPEIGILVATSNQMESQLLGSALRRRPEFKISSCPAEANAIVNALTDSPVQVAVLNADQPRNGLPNLGLVRRIHVAHPQVAKVLLVDRYDRDIVVSAFRSGAKGLFCISNCPFRLLCKCIHSVHRGQVWANSEQLQFLVEELAQVPRLRMVNAKGTRLLTEREEQVVALVADGLSNREVAQELSLSEHTIKKYLFRIFDKLGISSRVELVLYALNNGGSRPAEWLAVASA